MYEASEKSGGVSSLLSKMIADPSGGVLRGLRADVEEILDKAEAEVKSNPTKRDEIEAMLPLFRAAQDILDKAEIEVHKIRGGR